MATAELYAAHRVVRFTWSRRDLALIALSASLASTTMVAHHTLSTGWALATGGLITVSFGSYCLYRIIHETGVIARLRRKRGR